MIIVRNRELLIPRNEALIGTPFDSGVVNRFFKIDRVQASMVDLSLFTFALDVKYADGVEDTLAVTKDINDEYMVLSVTFPEELPVGNIIAQLRAADLSGRTWSSAKTVFYVLDSYLHPGTVTPSTSLTELEQLETTIEASEAIREAAEAQRIEAESERAEAEDSRAEAETERAEEYAEMKQEFADYIEQAEANAKLSESWAVGGTGTRQGENINNSKYYAEHSAESAQNASQSEEAAQGYKDAAEGAKEAAETAQEKAEAAVAHYPEIRFVSSPTQGYYWFVWDSENEVYVNTNVRADGGGNATWGTITGDIVNQEDLVAALGAKYEKPAAGIPKADLASGVQGTLDKADGSVRFNTASQGLTDTEKAQARENIGVFLDLKDTVTHTQYRLGIENGIMYIEDYEEET